MQSQTLPRSVIFLGLAGWVPQLGCIALTVLANPMTGLGQAAGTAYAALILSFLGGLWWMAGLMSDDRRASTYLLAVLPSLAGWAALLAWLSGRAASGTSLVALGLLLLASPLADRLLARRFSFPRGWLALRALMAGGLGMLTLALASL